MRQINYTPESVEERRKYALLQAAALLASQRIYSPVDTAIRFLEEIEKREKEKRFE